MTAALLGSNGSGILLVLYIALAVLMIAGWWKIFTKAGKPGWGVLIPFYNLYLMCKIAKRPGWWFILFLIPFVGFVIQLIVMLDIAKRFFKTALFGVGLFLLPFIFGLILGFGDAVYDDRPTAA
jgi:hypothetical protein